MDPQQYPTGQNPYDFILNPAKPPKPSKLSKLPGSSNPLVFKLVLLAGGALLLMLTITVITNLLSSGTRSNVSALTSIAQTQNEIVRVAERGATNATQQNVKNLAVTTQLSVATQQQQLLAYMARNGTKVSSKQLKLKQDAKTDQKFTLAKQTSTFDAVFSKTMQTQLQSYAADLKELFDVATSENQRTLLSTDYTQAQLLLSQVPSPESLQSN